MLKHTGNVQNEIANEEHEAGVMPPTKRVLPYGYDGSIKNLFFVDSNGIQRSIVTVASVINTTFVGNVTLNPSSAFIGLATTVIGSAPTLFAVVNTAVAGQASVVLDTGTKYIGLVTVANTIPVTGTFYQATQPVSGTFYQATQPVSIATMPSTPVTGTFWQSTQPVSFSGNITLNPSPNFIGLISTASIQGKVELVTGSAAIGKLAANSGVDIGDVDILSIAAGTNNIGDMDILSIAAGDNNIGNMDVVTLPSLVAGTAFIGQATVRIASNNGTDIGDVNLLAGTAWIGLATVIPAVPTSIVHGMVSSASGGVIQFATNTIKWTQIKAMANNPTTIFLGGSTATINNGYALEPGETTGFSISNTNLLYLSNGYGNAEVRYIGGN